MSESDQSVLAGFTTACAGIVSDVNSAFPNLNITADACTYHRDYEPAHTLFSLKYPASAVRHNS